VTKTIFPLEVGVSLLSRVNFSDYFLPPPFRLSSRRLESPGAGARVLLLSPAPLLLRSLLRWVVLLDGPQLQNIGGPRVGHPMFLVGLGFFSCHNWPPVWTSNTLNRRNGLCLLARPPPTYLLFLLNTSLPAPKFPGDSRIYECPF